MFISNKLTQNTTDKLLYIHSNIRFHSRFCDNYKEGPHCKWDIDPDNSILRESSLKHEKLRRKKLDNDFVDEQQTLDKGPPRKIHDTIKASVVVVSRQMA